MNDTKKIRLKENMGNPQGGPVLRAGAVLEIAASWADKWIAQGRAELISEEKAPPAKPKGKKNAK